LGTPFVSLNAIVAITPVDLNTISAKLAQVGTVSVTTAASVIVTH